MKLESMSFFSLASRKMEWLTARQKVVAENVANADTPGYKARDVAPFENMLTSTTTGTHVARTAAGHIAGTDPVGPGLEVVEDEGAWTSTSIDGNSVVLEQQAIQATEISENYRLAASLYRKGYELVTLAVTGIR